MLSLFEAYALIISLFSIFFLILLVRFKGIFEWRFSLGKRLSRLRERAETCSDEKQKEAYSYVYRECSKIYRKNYYFKPDIIDLFDFIKNISLIYNPSAKNSVLEISLGDFLYFSNITAQKIESILRRKPLGAVYNLKIKKLYFGFDVLNIFMKNKFLNSLAIIWKNYSLLNIILWFNPLGLLVFLSMALLRMSIVKFVVSDIYIFAGENAAAVYSGEIQKEFSLPDKAQNFNFSGKKELLKNSKLKKIKKDLLFKTLIFGTIPSEESFKKAFFDSALIISSIYFKNSRSPLKEAKVGLILERTAHWLRILSGLTRKRIVKYFFNIKLSSVFSAYDFQKKYLPQFLKNGKNTFKKSLTIANYSRVLLKVYKARSPYSFLSFAGSEYGKNILVFYILKTSCEKMILEIDYVYKNSQ